MQNLLEMWRDFGHALHQVFLLQQIQCRQARRARHRMRRIGIAVRKLHRVLRRRLVHESLVDLAAGNDRPHRNRTVGDLLGDAHQVGRHAETVSTEHRTRAAETGNHFVEYQQDIVLVANLPQALEVALRRNQHTGGPGHGLDEDGRNVGGVVQLDQLQQFVGQGNASLFRHATGIGIARQQGMGQVIDVRHCLAKQFAVAAYAAQAGTCDVHAVVATGTPDHFGLGRLALETPVGANHLYRRIGALGTGVGEEHMIEIAWRQAGDSFRELERQRMTVLEPRRVIEGAQLLGDRVLDFLAGVPGTAGPQTRQ